MSDLQAIALYVGVAWASGLNLYATILILAFLEMTGQLELPPSLSLLSNSWILALAAALYAIEFVADKIPWVDSAWDAIHTFIRIPAGALLALGSIASVDPVTQTLAVLLGGTISAGTHGVKMTTRLVINTMPEPVTNWLASLSEDALVVSGLILMAHYPAIFLLTLFGLVAVVLYFLLRLFKAARLATAQARARYARL